MTKPMVYIANSGFYDGLTKRKVYDVMEYGNRYFIQNNDHGSYSILSKNKFVKPEKVNEN